MVRCEEPASTNRRRRCSDWFLRPRLSSSVLNKPLSSQTPVGCVRTHLTQLLNLDAILTFGSRPGAHLAPLLAAPPSPAGGDCCGLRGNRRASCFLPGLARVRRLRFRSSCLQPLEERQASRERGRRPLTHHPTGCIRKQPNSRVYSRDGCSETFGAGDENGSHLILGKSGAAVRLWSSADF